MTDPLLQAVRNLTLVVDRLEKTLREDYPKRAEIERRFTTRREQEHRRRTWAISILLMVLISGVLSFAAATATVSVCFLSTDARSGTAPAVCDYWPGYKAYTSYNKRRMKQTEQLLKDHKQDDKRLDRIEKRLGIQ